MGRRAWTILELVITMALALALMVATAVSFRRPTSRANSRAMADQVAEAFRAARNLAMAEQSPVALLIPSPAGSHCSQSIAFLRGEDHPAISRVLDYHREFPRSVIFVGTYPSSGSWSIDPIPAGRSAFWETDLISSAGAKPLLNWLGARSDKIFLFSPDGCIHGNDLPHIGQNYYVVVSQGVVAGSTAPPSAGLPVLNQPPYSALSQACDPYTVVVGALGSVQVVPGLPQASGVTLSPSALALANVAPAPAVASEPVTNPNLTLVSFNPAGSAAASLGVGGTLDPERQVQVSVQANIATSDDLFCSITCSGVRPSTGATLPGGSFSTPGAKRMFFIPPAPPLITSGVWISNWQWNPPPQAIAQDRFTFDVTVTTRRGGVVTSSGFGGASRTVEMFSQGKIFFGAQDPYTSKYMIYSIRADGTDLTRVTHNEATTAQLYPAATRDGNKLLFAGVEPMVSSDLFALSRTGGLSTRITVANQPAFRSHFSDDSAVGVYEGADVANGDYQLYCFNPNSLWPPSVAKVFSPSPAAAGNPVGIMAPAVSGMMGFTTGSLVPADTRRCNAPRRLAFEGDCAAPGVRAIYTSNFCNPGTSINPLPLPGPSNIRRQTNGGPGDVWGGGDRFPCWHPAGGYLAFHSDRAGGQKIFRVTFSESGHESGPDGAVCLTPAGTNCIEPYYSPDGLRMCWLSNDGGSWDIYVSNIDPATGDLVAGTTRALGLSAFTPFTGGFPNLNRPIWTQ